MNSSIKKVFYSKGDFLRHLISVSFFTFLSVLSFGQTTLYTQDFEVDMTGYMNVPNQIPSDDPGDQYFSMAMPSDAAIYEGNVGPYTNVTGDHLFVGSNPNTINSGMPGEIIFDQIDITGFTNITFSADFGGVNNDWDATDLLSVEYSIDGGTFATLYSFASPVTNDPLALQGNAVGGANTANGTILTYALQTITSELVETGMTLDLKIICNSGANYEAFGVDNISVTGVMAGADPEVAVVVDAQDVDEAAGVATVCVNVFNPSDAPISVDLVVVGGTATDPMDYTYTTQTITFPAGDDTPQCVDITITDDTVIDEGETIELMLQNAVGADIGTGDMTIVTIIDNDKLTCPAPEWMVVSPIPTEEWSPSGNGFQANGYCGNGCEQDVETWLIYGPLDMTGVTLLELEFLATEGFGVTDLNVQFTDQAGANSCPDEATWTSAGMITETSNSIIDLSAATGTEVYIGIEYSDDGVDGFSQWTLTDFVLSADLCPTIGLAEVPMVEAGGSQILCGLEDVTMTGSGNSDGMWSGGAGSFDDPTSPTAVYTPDASEEGTTVVLTYTLDLTACAGFSDDVNITFFAEPGDTEFAYLGDLEICPNGDNPMVTHITGVDGTYTVTMGEPDDIALDPATGEIDLMNTINGEYEITNTIAGSGNIIITGAIDGPLSGGVPKAIEFYTLDFIPDLSIYSFGSANNGGGSDGEEFVFPADEIPANTYFYLASTGTDFNIFFGFAPDYVDNTASINGDDALELFCSGVVIDVFGDINTDGNGEAWEYLDGWAYRVNDSAPNKGDFVVSDFTYSGPNALDGETTNAGAATPFPIGTFTTTQMGICPNSSFSVTITVGDNTPPVIECPGDILVGLEPGECNELAFFTVPFSDNCGTIDAEMSQAVNEALVSTALDCANNTSNHLRYFENTLPVPVEISQVNFGVFFSGTDEVVTVNVYSIGPGAPFIYANMTLEGTTDFAVPSGMNQALLTADIEATIPAGMNYVLELKASTTQNFVVGYNTAGETGSTYISGNDPVPCVSLEPTDIDDIGFPTFAVILYSDAEGGPSIEQTEGLPSGSYFDIGSTTITFVATDVNGNTAECTFDVIVTEFPNVSGTLACNDNINVSLDSDCEVVLGASMLLEGNSYGCYDDYIIEVSGGVLGNVITEPGTYTVTVTDPDSGNSCWSTINVEGKAAPILDCSAALCPLEMLQGEWSTADNTFSPGASWAFDGNGPNNDILYDVIEFVVDVPGDYTLTMTPSDEFDGIAGIYAGSFDPANPGMNLVGGDDDIAGVFESEPDFTIFLAEGNYILVSSTWGAGQMGVYSWTFSGPGQLFADCQLKCYELDALLSGELELPAPGVTSCSPYELYYSDNVSVDDCGATIVTRTYLAENENGSSTCEIEYELDPLSTLLDITLPQSQVILSCNSGTDPVDIVAAFDNPLTSDNNNTAIVENNEGFIYAFPTYTVNGHPQKIESNVCNIYAGYTDQNLEVCDEGCGGNKKVIRTWTIVDWCTLQTSDFVQIIKAMDEEAPTLITKDITVSTDAWGCVASFDVPLPWELHDNCDAAPKYDVTGPAGVSVDGSFEAGFYATGVQKGENQFSYVAYDCCGNEASYTFNVTVRDITPPVAIAKQNIVISLTSSATTEDGFAKLYTESVDNGSFDGCSDNVKLELRRDSDFCDVRGNETYNADGHPQDGSSNPISPNFDSDEGAFVKFCCNDLTNATVDVNGDGELDPGYVKVWMRVWDDGDMDGIYGSEDDNYNETWVYVKVEDKLAPTIVCPPDVTLTCDMDYTDLGMTGNASAFGSCGGVDVEYNDIIINLNTCNEGFVRRRWNVVGRSDIFCDQTITLDEIDGPDVVVSFSQLGDFTAANCPSDIALGEPTWIAGACDVLAYTVATDTFKFEDGACYKLVNHWTVINWCDYNPNNAFWNGEGLWEHTQIVKVTDETLPVIEDCEDKMFAINDHGDSDDDGEVCEAMVVLTNVATDPGSDNCPTGWLKWQVLVDLWGDGTIDYEYSSFLPPFDSQFNDTNGNGIPDMYLSPTANGETVSVALPDIVGSMSNHKVSWKVTDGCNNVTTCDNEFMVVDKKAPTPYMIDISSAVMETSCTVELWAIDFNIGSFDNCTAQEDLIYTFSATAPEDDSNYIEAQQSSSMTFGIEDVMNSPVSVNVYVWDEKGNADFAVVYLTLVDNQGCIDDPVEDPIDACTCDPTEHTGWAVATCNADEGTDGAVGVIYDIRNTQDAPLGSDWAASINAIHPANWTVDQIGQIFGIAIDGNENVFLAASDVYDTQFENDPYGPGQIFKASASNGFLAEPFVELPNTGGPLNGIGNIVYCTSTDMLYASNLEDGTIYRINAAGQIMETYDPWAPGDDGGVGIINATEQVWALGLNVEDGVKKLYFPRVGGGERTMSSIALNADGSFPASGSEVEEFRNIMGVGLRISDIAFNTAGDQMIFTERGSKFLTGAHDAKTLRYDLQGNGVWEMNLQYNVGGYVTDDFPSIGANPGENSGGGVDFGATTVSDEIEGCDEIVWNSMNYFEDNEGGLFYGMQGMDVDGNNSNLSTTDPNSDTDIILDFDGDYVSFEQKGEIGDVEIFRCASETSNKVSIEGTIATEEGQMVHEVKTSLLSILPEYPLVGEATGQYVFDNLPKNVEYQITAEKNGDWLNGVSTLDLVKIQRHILGLEELDSPYKLIAADVNNDESVKASDLSVLRKLILGVTNDIADNTSWRFVDAEQTFADPSAPWPVDESIETGMVVHDMTNQDFVAVKIGDVSGNAIANLMNTTAEVRSGKSIEFMIDEQEVKEGDVVDVVFSSADFTEVLGYQFTLELNGLNYTGLQEGVVSMTNENIGVLSSNMITVSYNNAIAKNANASDDLFTMTFVATQDGSIGTMIEATSKMTVSEAYIASGASIEVRDVSISTRGGVGVVATSELFQNEPNPFRDQTNISFNLEESAPATLTVSDMTGRVILVNNIAGVQGLNSVTLTSNQLGANGVLYYTLESGEFTSTKKMIIIK